MKNLLVFLCSMLLVLGMVGVPGAMPSLTFDFNGTVTNVELTGTGGSINNLNVNVGDSISGFFLIDYSKSDLDSDPKVGIYQQSIVGGLTFFIGGSEINIDSYQTQVRDNYQDDRDIFEIQAWSNISLDGIPISMGGDMDFTAAPLSTFTGDSLPDPSIIANWPGDINITLRGDPANTNSISVKNITISLRQNEPTIENILEFFDEAVAAGTIHGRGRKSCIANARLWIFGQMLETAQSHLENGRINRACRTLNRIVRRCDGEPWPMDYIEGEAVPELYNMILDLMEIECE
jgi:hypothetical protein